MFAMIKKSIRKKQIREYMDALRRAYRVADDRQRAGLIDSGFWNEESGKYIIKIAKLEKELEGLGV